MPLPVMNAVRRPYRRAIAPVGSVPAAIPHTNTEIGSVASPGSGAMVEPMMAAVAKTTVALAPASAWAAARRRALRRARRVLMPNPFYPTYQHATLLQGGAPVYYDATAADPRPALEASLVDGQIAAMLLCHPGAPHGQVYAPEVLAGLQALCVRNGARLLDDECYIDSHAGPPPQGYLSRDAQLDNVLVFHSLSKRSAAPGLRSGFVAGDAQLVEEYAWANRQLGVSAAAPICAAAAAAWDDEGRVAQLNKRIAASWALARRHLAGWPGFQPTESGFFLWLPVARDEEFARNAWAKAGLRIMPGSYLAATVAGVNPGRGFVRIALVHEPALMDRALARLAMLDPAA